MHSQRAEACAVALGDKIYVSGGNDETNCLSSCEVFDPRGESFTMLRMEMCGKRRGACAAAVAESVFIFGGMDGDFNSLFSCEIFLPLAAAVQSWMSCALK